MKRMSLLIIPLAGMSRKNGRVAIRLLPPAVTSQQVAEIFGKRHDHVLRDIEQILTQVPEIFGRLNFELSEYTDSTGRSLDGVESDIDN